MNSSLVITVLATDRPGLVSSLSEVLRTHHANWMDSRMSRLAGKFAGILHVSIDEQHIDELKTALKAIPGIEGHDLQVQIEKSEHNNQTNKEKLLKLEVLGQDRPGIIEDITRKLATLSVNIEEMCSEQRVASMSNELLFFANLSLQLPKNIQPEAVQDALEELSDQLMVDLNFS
jgi:glycine cleavage system regulatory protein